MTQSVFIVLRNVPFLHLGDLIAQALIDEGIFCGYGAR